MYRGLVLGSLRSQFEAGLYTQRPGPQTQQHPWRQGAREQFTNTAQFLMSDCRHLARSSEGTLLTQAVMVITPCVVFSVTIASNALHPSNVTASQASHSESTLQDMLSPYFASSPHILAVWHRLKSPGTYRIKHRYKPHHIGQPGCFAAEFGGRTNRLAHSHPSPPLRRVSITSDGYMVTYHAESTRIIYATRCIGTPECARPPEEAAVKLRSASGELQL